MKFRYGDCGRLLLGDPPPGGDAAARRCVLSGVHVTDDGGDPTSSGRPVSEFSTYGPAVHASGRCPLHLSVAGTDSRQGCCKATGCASPQ